MDYGVFSAEFEEEIKSIQLQTKHLGRSKFYKLFKSDKIESDSTKVSYVGLLTIYNFYIVQDILSSKIINHR